MIPTRYLLSIELRECDDSFNAGDIVVLDQAAVDPQFFSVYFARGSERFLEAFDALLKDGTRTSQGAIDADVRTR